MEEIMEPGLDVVFGLSVASFSTRKQIEELEKELLYLPQVDVPVLNTIHDGIYCRQITLPAGAFAIGHEHTGDFINIVVKGKCSVLIDGSVREIGPSTFISKGHDRKVGYIHEDTTWITVHRTDLDSINEIENSLFIKSKGYIDWEESKKLNFENNLSIKN